EQSVVHVMPGIFRADLVVGSVQIAGGYVEAPLEEGVLRELEQVPGVALVVGEHSSDWHYADGPIAIHAVDRRFFLDPRFERWPLVGSAVPDVWRLMAAGEVAIVSTNLSHNLGMALGDFLDIETPSGPLRLRVGGMVRLGGGCGVADTIAAGVLERRREIAAMGALGARRGRLGRMILVEASLIGVCGLVLALAVGLALGVLWVKMTFPDLVGWTLELHVPGLYFVVVSAAATAVCLVAALLPAYRSARIELGSALRYE